MALFWTTVFELTRYWPLFHQISFNYDFDYMIGDETYIAHSFQYTFTRLLRYLRDFKQDEEIIRYTKDAGIICNSISGVDVHYLIMTTKAHLVDFNLIQTRKSIQSKAYLRTEASALLSSQAESILERQIHPSWWRASSTS